MSKRSPVAIFLAASTLLSVNGTQAKVSHPSNSRAVNPVQGQLLKGENHYPEDTQIVHHHNNQKQQGIGGLKEWTTDQEVDEEGVLDDSAQKAAKKAKKANACIPIGEGENCW